MIEADFYSYYGIDLLSALDDLTFTWRRFKTLLGGLGPNTATVAHIQAQAQQSGTAKSGISSRTITIDADRDPDRVDALFASMAVKLARKPKAKRNGAQSR